MSGQRSLRTAYTASVSMFGYHNPDLLPHEVQEVLTHLDNVPVVITLAPLHILLEEAAGIPPDGEFAPACKGLVVVPLGVVALLVERFCGGRRRASWTSWWRSRSASRRRRRGASRRGVAYGQAVLDGFTQSGRVPSRRWRCRPGTRCHTLRCRLGHLHRCGAVGSEDSEHRLAVVVLVRHAEHVLQLERFDLAVGVGAVRSSSRSGPTRATTNVRGQGRSRSPNTPRWRRRPSRSRRPR